MSKKWKDKTQGGHEITHLVTHPNGKSVGFIQNPVHGAVLACIWDANGCELNDYNEDGAVLACIWDANGCELNDYNEDGEFNLIPTEPEIGHYYHNVSRPGDLNMHLFTREYNPKLKQNLELSFENGELKSAKVLQKDGSWK